jgi:hypothetical protein
MPTYQVYYARRPTYHASGQLGTPLLTVPRLRHTHVRVTTVEADSRAEAWLKMQGENWSPRGEARPLIEHMGLTHTSMSVGDVLRDEEGVYWECLDLGWRRIDDGTREGDHVLHEKAPE